MGPDLAARVRHRISLAGEPDRAHPPVRAVAAMFVHPLRAAARGDSTPGAARGGPKQAHPCDRRKHANATMHEAFGFMARWSCILRRVCVASMLGAIGCEVTGSVGGPAQGDDAATSTGGVLGESTGAPARDEGSDDSSSSANDELDDAAGSTSDATSSDASSSEGSTSNAESGNASTGGTAGDSTASCCSASTVPGCGDAIVEACVCALDSYCCESGWDDACVATASSDACDLACGGPEPAAPVDCCAPADIGNAGCDDAATQDCVCAYDPYCCLQTWDELCVGYVDDYGCGACI
jgi:hypothetical protein